MKIVPRSKTFTFVYPDFEYNVTKTGIKPEPGGWYHEGIAQLAAIIEQKEWNVNLIHLRKPLKKEKFLELISEHDPDIVGFSVRTGVREYAKNLIKWTASLDKFIIAGSYHPTLWPDEVIKWEGIDAICLGEGEKPVEQLLDAANSDKEIDSIGSLWFKDGNGKIKKNTVQPLNEKLDDLPLPKFEIFDFKNLIASQIKAAIIVLTRGCPYNCTYCWNNFARNLYPNKQCYVRYRSPKNCIKYIEKVKEAYPEVMSFRFQDDLWPFYNDWFENFSKEYDEHLALPFECHLRANLLTEDIIKRLKEIKCFGIYFGVESGNDYIRNTILKRNMTEQVLLDAFSACRKHGIRTHAYNIVGLPHENMKTVLDTVKLNAKLQPTDMFFPVFFPYAGSELYKIAVESGYFDPAKPLKPDVNVEMPDFKKNQIKFSSLYSKTFVRLYQLVFKLPGVFKRVFESTLDIAWLFPYWPFPLCNWYIKMKRKFEGKLKVFIKMRFFNLYLILKK
ncbi:MAG: radical SAM protein [Patescibacteria group bacterium]|nr:B12-binding domain-containing radical SAM protein [Patescibacteria group bacterium]